MEEYRSAVRFFEHRTAGYFTISLTEYEQIPEVVFSGLTIYQELYEQYVKAKKR